MTAAMVNIIAQTFIAAMLAVVMSIVWRSFGRPRHALIWAQAFLLASIVWGASLLTHLYDIENLYYYPVLAGLSCLSNALIAIGFVKRRHPAANMLPLLLSALAVAVLIGVATAAGPPRAVRNAAWLFFGGAMLIVGAVHVSPSFKRASLPERAFTIMLVLVAIFDLGSAAGILGRGALEQTPGFALFRDMFLLFYPLTFIGIGIFMVFLVAADLAESIRALATCDLLTGVYNRRGFEDAAERAIRNAQRQRQPLAMVVADIDNFGTITDRHGYEAGQRALRHFAARTERLVRRGDLIGRLGDAQFALLLVNARALSALQVVERIRRDIAAVPIDGPARISMTASFGITGLRPGDISLAALLSRADRALYRSKLEGRDRVTSAEDIDELV